MSAARAAGGAATAPAATPAAVSIERLLALALALDDKRPLAARALAARLGVSLRTVYRDVARLQAAGVPVTSEPGRGGGLLLAPGFRLAPLALTAGETVALALAIESLRAQPALPFRAQLESAARKISAAAPGARIARPELLEAPASWLRIEPPAADMFHPERPGPPRDDRRTGEVVQRFVEALVGARSIWLDYRSPYRRDEPRLQVDPAGLVADRGLWYLVGYASGSLRRARHFRADRVLQATLGPRTTVARRPAWRPAAARPWLVEAMQGWTASAPVQIEVDAAQARRLAADWYFACGRFEPAGEDRVHFTWGEGEIERVRELLAWLGPPARLLAPRAWCAPIGRALAAHGRLIRQAPRRGAPE